MQACRKHKNYNLASRT